MLYISSAEGVKFGVTDTEDWIEEFFTVEELKGILRSMGDCIRGIKCNGEDIELSVTNPACETIEKLQLGQGFTIRGFDFVYVGVVTEGNSWYVYDMRTRMEATLTREKLLDMGSKTEISLEYNERMYSTFKAYMQKELPNVYDVLFSGRYS